MTHTGVAMDWSCQSGIAVVCVLVRRFDRGQSVAAGYPLQKIAVFAAPRRLLADVLANS
jgi:hypothetical protein